LFFSVNFPNITWCNTKLKHLLVETSVDKKAMESLSEETKKDIFGEVYTDSIGKEGTKGQ
jgi:ABC-type Zn uptake system ZnuABC Zn-binding protein ZnuA